MEDVREVEMEIKEIIPGLELLVAKNFEKKYLDLQVAYRNGVDIIEYAAKTDLESVEEWYSFLKNNIVGMKLINTEKLYPRRNSKDIRQIKCIMEERIKKLETIPDMIKELIEWDKKLLKVVKDAIDKQNRGEEV